MSLDDDLAWMNAIRRVRFHLPSGLFYDSDFDANMGMKEIKKIIGLIASIKLDFSLFYNDIELPDSNEYTLNSLFKDNESEQMIVLYVIMKTDKEKILPPKANSRLTLANIKSVIVPHPPTTSSKNNRRNNNNIYTDIFHNNMTEKNNVTQKEIFTKLDSNITNNIKAKLSSLRPGNESNSYPKKNIIKIDDIKTKNNTDIINNLTTICQNNEIESKLQNEKKQKINERLIRARMMANQQQQKDSNRSLSSNDANQKNEKLKHFKIKLSEIVSRNQKTFTNQEKNYSTITSISTTTNNFQNKTQKMTSICCPIPKTNTIKKYDENGKEEIIPIEFPSNSGLFFFIESSSYCNSESYLYISGGKRNMYDFDVMKIFFQIDKKNNKVDSLPDMLYSHENHSMIYEYPYIFVIGGTNSNKAEMYNLLDNNWYLLPNLKKGRQFSMLHIYQKKYLYCFFGKRTSNLYEDSIERFNYYQYIHYPNPNNENNQWEIIQYDNSLNIKLNYCLCGLVERNNELYFLGGESPEKNTSSIYSYSFIYNRFLIHNCSMDIKEGFRENKLYSFSNPNQYIQFSLSNNFPIIMNLSLSN